MSLCDDVREHCAAVASGARSVSIDLAALRAFEAVPQATLDPALHHLEGTPEETARSLLILDSINFGSGWFPTLRKRLGHSGYGTVAAALRERFRAERPWSNEQLRAIDTETVAQTLGQPADHELMALYSQALRPPSQRPSARSACE